MKLSTIILALRLSGTSFGDKIGGIIELSAVKNNTLTNEVAFVIPYDEEAGEDSNDTSANQKIKERFTVIAVLKNDANLNDKTGLAAYDRLHGIRNELFKVLINFDVGYENTIAYDRGRLLEFNPAWIWYRYDFTTYSRIVSDESGFGYVEEKPVGERVQPSQIPAFNEVYAEFMVTPGITPPYTGKLPAGDYIDISDAQSTDINDDPNLGGYDSGFARAFKKLLS